MKSLLLLLAIALLLPAALIAQQPGSARGRIINKEGITIDDAQIRITGPDNERMLIGESGWFSASDLLPGDYTVEIFASGYRHYTMKLHVVEGKMDERNYCVLVATGDGSPQVIPTNATATRPKPDSNEPRPDLR